MRKSAHAKNIVDLIGPPDKASKKKLMEGDDDGDDYEDDVESVHADYRVAVEEGDDALAARLFKQMVQACSE